MIDADLVVIGFGKGGKTLAATLRDGIYTHPSMSEAFNQLLGALHD